MKAKINQYDRLIILFIALLSFGIFGGAFTPIRLFVIVCIPFYLKDNKINNRRSYKYESYFFIFWLLYALISIFWVINPIEGIKTVVYLMINFLSFFILIWMSSRASDPYKSIINGWILSFILTVPIALVEIFFDKHLSLSYFNSYIGNFGDDVYLQRNLASVTFGNINSYSNFLCYFSPFILFSIIRKKTLYKWLIFTLIILIAFINASRGAILCLSINILIFIFYSIKNNKNIKNIFIYLLVLCSISFFLFSFFYEYFQFAVMRITVEGVKDDARIDIINYGLRALIDSNLFGIGTANYIPYMEKNTNLLNTAPHNLFIEILVQYGLVIFIGFVILGYRIYKISRNRMPFNNIAMVLGLLTLIFSSFIDSGYLLGSVIWIFLASIYVLVDYRYNNND